MDLFSVLCCGIHFKSRGNIALAEKDCNPCLGVSYLCFKSTSSCELRSFCLEKRNQTLHYQFAESSNFLAVTWNEAERGSISIKNNNFYRLYLL